MSLCCIPWKSGVEPDSPQFQLSVKDAEFPASADSHPRFIHSAECFPTAGSISWDPCDLVSLEAVTALYFWGRILVRLSRDVSQFATLAYTSVGSVCLSAIYLCTWITLKSDAHNKGFDLLSTETRNFYYLSFYTAVRIFCKSD